MNIEEQKTTIEAESRYNSAPDNIIKNNIIHILNESGYMNNFIADKIGISEHTIYSWRKSKGGSKPDFITALKLCNFLGISIDLLITE